jgi:hypothetical protein
MHSHLTGDFDYNTILPGFDDFAKYLAIFFSWLATTLENRQVQGR